MGAVDKFLRVVYRRRWALTVAILCISFLAMNVLTPYIADDYGNLPKYAAERTTSLAEIINTAQESYQNWGGRFVASLFTALFAGIPAYIFDFLNTLAYFLATALIYLICKGDHPHNLVLYAGIHIMLWICVPDYGQVMFWLCGSTNYLWTTLPILGMIYLFRRYGYCYEKALYKPVFGIFTFLLGLIAGCGMENSSAGMIVASTLYLFYFRFYLKIKIRLPIICGYIGSLIGFSFLVFAPGNRERLNASEDLPLLFKFFVINYYWIMFAGILSVLFVVLFFTCKHREHCCNKLILQAGIFVLSAVFSAYCMLAAPTSPERTWFITCVYMVCANGILFSRINTEMSGHVRKGVALFSAGLFIMMFVSMMDTMIYSYEITVQTRERERYILEQKSQGHMDITTPVITHKYPLRSHHDALTGLSDIQTDPSYWVNQVLADYYGVHSITGSSG